MEWVEFGWDRVRWCVSYLLPAAVAALLVTDGQIDGRTVHINVRGGEAGGVLICCLP